MAVRVEIILRVGVWAEGVVNFLYSAFPLSISGSASSCGGLLYAALSAFNFPRRLGLRAGTSATSGIGIFTSLRSSRDFRPSTWFWIAHVYHFRSRWHTLPEIGFWHAPSSNSVRVVIPLLLRSRSSVVDGFEVLLCLCLFMFKTLSFFLLVPAGPPISVFFSAPQYPFL